MGLKLSVIVPIFKVEPYLRKCIDCLLEQDLSPEDYEIILVDDGSPDECPGICDKFAVHYKNVKVIHQINKGLSAARNSGLVAAQGEYVQFVDADDYLEPDVLKGLVEKMDQDELDVLRFNYQNVNERYEVFEPNKVGKPFVDYRDEVCDGLTFLTERLGYACYAVQFMIRRDLLDDCVFKEGIVFEDVEWTPRMLMKAKRVTSTDRMVYNYLIRSGSITQSREKGKKLKAFEDKLGLIDSLQSQMQEVTDKRWFRGFAAHLTIGLISDISKCFFENRKALIDRIKSRSVFPLSYYHATKQTSRKIRIANLSPMLLCYLLRLKQI